MLFYAIFLSTALGYSYLYRSFEPGDESELSDLDKDDYDETSACNNHRVEFDDIEGEDISGEQVNDNQKTNTCKEKIQDSTLNQPAFAKKMKLNDYNYRWCNVSPSIFDTSFGGEEIDVQPENFEELKPLNYFQMLWNKDLIKLIAEQTNLYSVQKDGKRIAITEDEIKQFISI